MFELTVEYLQQSIFLAAIVLMVFSIPRCAIETIWYELRDWTYKKGAVKIYKSKKPYSLYFRRWTAKKVIHSLDNPQNILNARARALESFVKSIRTPLIEGIISTILIFISLVTISFDDQSKFYILILLVFMGLVILITGIMFGHSFVELNKMLSKIEH